MTTLPPIIHVVDDDASFRAALGKLLSACGYRVALYESAEQLLKTAGRGSRLYSAGCANGRLERAAVAGSARRARMQAAHRLRNRSWRHSDDGADDQGGRGRLPYQTGTEREIVGGDRARPHPARANPRAGHSDCRIALASFPPYTS